MPTLAEIKKAFADACAYLGIDTDFLFFEEKNGTVIVSCDVIIDDKYWRYLHEMVQSQLYGAYSGVEKGWVIPSEKEKESAPKVLTPQVTFKTAAEMAGIKGTRTGLPKPDEKLRELEAEKAEGLIAGKILLIELDKIKENRYNPNEMTDEEFKSLVENMRQEGPHGTDPILVRPIYHEKNDGVEIDG